MSIIVQIDRAKSRGGSLTGSNNQLKDVCNSIMASREMLRVMKGVCFIDQRNSTPHFLYSALRMEIDQMCIHVKDLLHEKMVNKPEIDSWLGQFEEEKVAWSRKEGNRIRSIVESVSRELETEKKLRRKTERINQKLEQEVQELKITLLKTTKELEKGKRAIEVTEQVCDELAQGVTEDQVEVERLKMHWEKVLDEIKKERKMIQHTDALREGHVQMKLLEAKYQFEEKNAAVDNLRNELECYLKSVKDEETSDSRSRHGTITELEKYLMNTLLQPYKYEETRKAYEEDTGLQSIELDLEDMNEGFCWISITEDEPAQNSNTNQEGRCRGWALMEQKQENVDFHGKKDMEDMERYLIIKDLRDQIASGAQIVIGK